MVEHFPILEDFCFGLLSPLKTLSITKLDLQQHRTDHLSTALKRVETAPGLLAEAKTIPTIERVGELVRLPGEREKHQRLPEVKLLPPDLSVYDRLIPPLAAATSSKETQTGAAREELG